MAIRALSRQELARFCSARPTLSLLTDKAGEWFADDAGVVLGAIAYHQFDFDWSCLVLRLDGEGKVVVRHRAAGFRDHDDAWRLLLEKMASAVATATKPCPPPANS